MTAATETALYTALRILPLQAWKQPVDGSSISLLEEAGQMNLAAVQAHITHEKDMYSEVRVRPTQKHTLLKLTLNEIRAALHPHSSSKPDFCANTNWRATQLVSSCPVGMCFLCQHTGYSPAAPPTSPMVRNILSRKQC